MHSFHLQNEVSHTHFPYPYHVCLKVCGYELLDLAHHVHLKEPIDFSIQSMILQALLRYAGFSHKVYDKCDSFVSESADSQVFLNLTFSVSLALSLLLSLSLCVCVCLQVNRN